MKKPNVNKGALKKVLSFLCCAVLATSVGVSTVLASAASYDNADANTTAIGNAMRDANGKFSTDYSTAEELNKAAYEFNETIGEEGMILLKNKDNALPFSKDIRKLSVFGKSSVKLAYGGSGSGSSSGGKQITLYDSLHNAGYSTNPVLENFYNDNEASGIGRERLSWFDHENFDYSHNSPTWMCAFFVNETPMSKYTKAVTDSYAKYNDAAIIVISRDASEGTDLSPVRPEKLTDIKGNLITKYDNSTESNYLAYTDDEKALIKHVKESGFGKIIVVLNLSNTMEVKEIADDPDIDGIIWVGHSGSTGMNALGKILKGEVNPSGRMVDVWDAKHSYDPTWQNVAYNKQVNSTNSYMQPKEGGGYENINAAHFIEYEEGIYVGYRYYETAGSIAGYNFSRTSGETWGYDDAVIWTFGYGLSYTTFEKTLKSKTETITKDGTIDIVVNVKNTGSYAGKDVVELYYEAPYTAGGIEKSKVDLAAFKKTKLLQPGESEDITLSIKVQDMASFDYDDANGNGFRGYELESGKYTLYVGNDAHCWADEQAIKVEYTVNGNDTFAKTATKGANGYKYTTDSETGNPVAPLFSNNDNYNSLPGITQSYSGYQGYSFSKMHQMSRADMAGTFPTAPEASEYQLTAAQAAELKMRHIFTPADDTGTAAQPSFYAQANQNTGVIENYNAPWYVATATAGWKQYDETRDGERKAPTYKFSQMSGWDYDDERWETVLNELSFNELLMLCSNGGYGNSAIDYIGKPAAIDQDGPAMIKGGDSSFTSCAWASECMIASTWNVEIAQGWGEFIGNEGLFRGTYGWYAPAMNTHHSPYGGRNFEYFSSDGVQGGIIAAYVVKGVQSKGIYAYIKHFALNDTDSERYSLSTACNEQAMRQIYLKQFEIAVEIGGANALMTGHNHIGNIPCHGNYALLTSLLRGEWGFKGVCVTDAGAGGPTDQKNNPNLRIRAGEDLPLGNGAKGVPQATYNAAENKVYTPLHGGYSTDEGKLDASGNVILIESPTTWAAARKSAKNTLYATCNSANALNGHDMSGFVGGAIEDAVVGTAYTKDISIGISGAEYTVKSGELPAGLTLNKKTGVISGTPAVAGEFTVTVQAAVDGWVKKTADYNITIAEKAGENVVGIKNWESEKKDGVTTITITFTDGTVKTITLKDGENGLNGAEGKTVTAGSVNGVAVAALIVAGVALVAEAVIAVILKRKMTK